MSEPIRIDTPSTQGTFDIETLHALKRGLLKGQVIRVSARDYNGHVFSGSISGIGGRIGINADDGELVEDIRAEWILTARVGSDHARY